MALSKAARARLGISVVEIEQAEFFVVSGGRIVVDGALEFADAAAAGKNLEFGAQQAGVGDNLNGDVDEGPEPSADEDDEQPVDFGTAADEVDDGRGLEHESPPVEEESHGERNIAWGGRASGFGYRASASQASADHRLRLSGFGLRQCSKPLAFSQL